MDGDAKGYAVLVVETATYLLKYMTSELENKVDYMRTYLDKLLGAQAEIASLKNLVTTLMVAVIALGALTVGSILLQLFKKNK